MSSRGSAEVLFFKKQPRRDSMYRVPRYAISLVREGSVGVEDKIARDSATARDILAPLFDGLDREQFVTMVLDAKHQAIGINVVSVGSLTVSIVHPREVFKPAILLNAAAVIVGHNHPSGDTTPSPEDHALTKRLQEAGKNLGIPLLDHLVLGESGNFFSFADQGLL
jgi:DNA repair protein RadC